MSNCENVLDNWEDLDEGLNIALSTLHTSSSSKSLTSVDSIASKLSEANHKQTPIKRDNQTNMKILQRSSKQDDTAPTYTRTTTGNAIAFNNSLMNSENERVTTKKLEVMATNFNPLTMVLHKTEDEYQSANYTAPTANQTVKILRRPTQSTEPRNIDVRPKQPLKSLKQREQEYAEARLRILGSAKNPEDECPSLNVAQPNSCVLSTNNSTANAASKNNSPRSQSGPNTYNNLYTYQQLQLQEKQHTSQLPLQTQKPQQQQSPPPASTQLQQYQQNFHSFNPKNYYYTLQQQQQQQSIPAYNNDRTKSMPLLGYTPNNMLTGGGLGKAQYQPQATMFTKYQQQQQQQQQQLQQTLYRHKSLQNQNQQQKPQQSWSPVVGGKVSYTTMRQKQQQQQLQHPEPILRLPRGPDGSNGFQIRR